MVRLDMSETQPESIMLNFCLPFLVPVVSTMCLYLSLFSTTCLQAGKDVSIRFGLWYVSICVARFLVLGILVNSSWKSSLGQVVDCTAQVVQISHDPSFPPGLTGQVGAQGKTLTLGDFKPMLVKSLVVLTRCVCFFLSVGGKKMKTYKRQVKCKRCEMCVCKKLEWFANWTCSSNPALILEHWPAWFGNARLGRASLNCNIIDVYINYYMYGNIYIYLYITLQSRNIDLYRWCASS